jgi:hypothetical protein
MARLYCNKNFPLPSVEKLRELGHDALTSYESGKAGQAVPDEDVLAFAVAEKRILLTLNRKHFIHLHTLKPDHCGIIVCTFDANFAALAERIDAALTTEKYMDGKLIRINRPIE